jgi:RND family efflux transporter MFP subunit
MKRFLTAILLTACLAALGIAAVRHFGVLAPLTGRPAAEAAAHAAPDAAPRQPEAGAVTVAAPVPRPVDRRVRTVGTLHGFEEIEISPLVDGTIRRLVRDVGDVVRPGEPLLEIDDTDFQLAVQEASRALDLELARLGLTAIPDGSFDTATLPTVERARLVERNAAETLERYRGLVARNVTTKDEFEKAELAVDTAKLDTKQRLLEAEQTLAAVRHRQAILETARKRLSDTRIVAPEITARAADGAGGVVPPLSYTVAERFVSEGEIVRAAPPTKLFRLIVEDVLKLKAAVPERHASQVKPGQAVELGVESLPGRKVAGRVVRVNPTIDTASRTFEIEVQVPNGERLLKSGAFATASVLVGVDADAVTVPEEAIVRFAGVTKVFAVVADQAVAVPVTVGVRMDVIETDGRRRSWIEVAGDFPPDAPVVTSGQSQLAAGTPVRSRAPAQLQEDTPDLRAARHDVPAAETGTAR